MNTKKRENNSKKDFNIWDEGLDEDFKNSISSSDEDRRESRVQKWRDELNSSSMRLMMEAMNKDHFNIEAKIGENRYNIKVETLQDTQIAEMLLSAWSEMILKKDRGQLTKQEEDDKVF